MRKFGNGSYKLQLNRARNTDDKEETGSFVHNGRTAHKNLQRFVTESKHVSSMRMITAQALVSSVMCLHMIFEKMLGNWGGSYAVYGSLYSNGMHQIARH